MKNAGGNPARSESPGGVRAGLEQVARVVRTIIGAPDYERYVEHLQRCHPDQQPLTREEFARDRLHARYSQAGNRCC
jgi:uncharacterized short protein YbdD (DUF466 family)